MCIDPKSLEPETRKPLHANACSSALQSKVQIFDRHRAGPRSTVDRQYQARGPRLLSTAAETVRLDSGDLGCSDPRLPCVCRLRCYALRYWTSGEGCQNAWQGEQFKLQFRQVVLGGGCVLQSLSSPRLPEWLRHNMPSCPAPRSQPPQVQAIPQKSSSRPSNKFKAR